MALDKCQSRRKKRNGPAISNILPYLPWKYFSPYLHLVSVLSCLRTIILQKRHGMSVIESWWGVKYSIQKGDIKMWETWSSRTHLISMILTLYFVSGGCSLVIYKSGIHFVIKKRSLLDSWNINPSLTTYTSFLPKTIVCSLGTLVFGCLWFIVEAHIWLVLFWETVYPFRDLKVLLFLPLLI